MGVAGDVAGLDDGGDVGERARAVHRLVEEDLGRLRVQLELEVRDDAEVAAAAWRGGDESGRVRVSRCAR